MSGINFPIKIDAKVSTALKVARDKIADMKAKVESINKTKIDPKVAQGFSNLKEHVGKLGESFHGQIKQIPMVGEALSGLLTKLGPVGIAVAALGTVIFGATTHFLKLAEEFGKTNKLFKVFEKNGDKVDKLTVKAKALQETFGYTDEELAKASKSISKTFGIDSVSAMEKLEKATISAGQKLPLEDITEFGTQIKSIGGSADSLLSTMSISAKQGLFSNKSLDALKEFGTRIRENNKATQELLSSTGNSKISKDVQKGLLTQEQAFKKVFSNIDKLSTSKQQELISGLLGGAGEDLGKEGLLSIAKFKGSLDDLIDKDDEIVKSNQKRLALESELAEAQQKNAKGFIPILKMWNEFKLKAQILFEKLLTPISQLFTDMWDSIKAIYDVFDQLTFVTVGIKLAFAVVVSQFKTSVAILRGALQLITSILKGFIKLKDYLISVFAKVFDKIFGDGAFKKVSDFFSRIKNTIVKVFSQLGDFFKNLWESINQGLQGNFKNAQIAFKKAMNSFSVVPGSDNNESEKGINKTSSSDVDKSISDNVDNQVKGASSEVKNITLNLEALQKIGTQNINNNNDVGDVGSILQKELLQLANDINQSGNN